MPKIIKDLEAKLIQEVKKQIEESGYSAMTIRSVAAGCGVGVGTVYNYVSSKEELVAIYLLNDWKPCVTAIGAVSIYAPSPDIVLECMFEHLLAYAQRHQAIFQDEAAAASFSGSFSHYHTMLRSQLARPLRRFCDSDFCAEFIAESLLTWSMAGKSFDEIWGMIEKLF